MFCLATSAGATDALRDLVQTLVPRARVEAADPSVLRHLPPGDLVILSVGSESQAAVSLLRELRARGNGDTVLVFADQVELLPMESLRQLGAVAVASARDVAALPAAIEQALAHALGRRGHPEVEALWRAVRQTQSLLAAGQLAGRLQHRLNNPLAALLAEAQLLELEPLAPEVATSVRRMVELCRRVIDETRSIDGLANASGGPG